MPRSSKTNWGTILFGIFHLFPHFALASGPQGKLMVVKGDVKVVRSGKELPARIGMDVQEKDAIKTGKDSRAKLVMKDKNEINVAPETQINLDQYIYQPSENKKNVLLNVVYGKVRSSVHQKYDADKNTFRVKTPSAVAGVRGTDFTTSFNQSTNASQVITFEGQVAVGTPGPGGTIANPVMVNPGQMTTVPVGQPPVPPVTAPASEMQQAKVDASSDSPSKSKPDNKPEGDKKPDNKEKSDKPQNGDNSADNNKGPDGDKKSTDNKGPENKGPDGDKKSVDNKGHEGGGEGDRKPTSNTNNGNNSTNASTAKGDANSSTPASDSKGGSNGPTTGPAAPSTSTRSPATAMGDGDSSNKSGPISPSSAGPNSGPSPGPMAAGPVTSPGSGPQTTTMMPGNISPGGDTPILPPAPTPMAWNPPPMPTTMQGPLTTLNNLQNNQTLTNIIQNTTATGPTNLKIQIQLSP